MCLSVYHISGRKTTRASNLSLLDLHMTCSVTRKPQAQAMGSRKESVLPCLPQCPGLSMTAPQPPPPPAWLPCPRDWGCDSGRYRRDQDTCCLQCTCDLRDHHLSPLPNPKSSAPESLPCSAPAISETTVYPLSQTPGLQRVSTQSSLECLNFSAYLSHI